MNLQPSLTGLREKRLLVLPVFYYVNPTLVRWQKGSFGEPLTKHKERLKLNTEKLVKWKMALHQVTDLLTFISHMGTPPCQSFFYFKILLD